MTPTRLLIGQILITFAIMALGVWASTQWAAAMLADQPQLGAPWFTLAGVPLYRPWSLFGWWHVFSSSARTPRFSAQSKIAQERSAQRERLEACPEMLRGPLPGPCGRKQVFLAHARISLDIFSRCSIVGVKEADSRDCRYCSTEVRNACFCARSSSRTRTSPFRSGSDL